MTAFVVLAAILLGAYAVTAITRWLEFTNAERERMDRFWLEVQAADWDEPSRAQVEWDMHVAEAIAVTDEPIFHATVAHIAAQEAAELDDEWRQIADGRWSM